MLHAVLGKREMKLIGRSFSLQYFVDCFTKLTLPSRVVSLKGSFPARYYIQYTSRDSYCLDNNCQAFLLVDDGSTGRRGGETSFRASLEDYISHQRTGIWGETETYSI